MVAGCGAKVAKFLLFIINFCVWAVGIVLIGVGAYVMVESAKYSYLFGDEDTLTTVSGIIIGTGCFIFLVGFCACCGAIKEIVCLLQVYFILILLVIILEVVAAILAFVYQDDLSDVVKITINQAIKVDYGKDKAATESLDLVQTEFDCCGGTDIKDWQTSAWALNNLGFAAPASCCKDPKETGCNVGAPGIPIAPNKMNTKGCVDNFQSWLKENYLIVGGVCLGLLVFEILALVFTCCLISGIKKGD